jgi:small subunit ribosomal protein S16
MSVKIRLARIGKKHVPFYRLIAIDSRNKRDGQYLDNIGTYDAINGKIVVFHEELYDQWLAKGAVATDSAKKIYKMHKKSTQSAPAKTTPSKAKTTKKAAVKPKAEPKATKTEKTEE